MRSCIIWEQTFQYDVSGVTFMDHFMAILLCTVWCGWCFVQSRNQHWHKALIIDENCVSSYNIGLSNLLAFSGCVYCWNWQCLCHCWRYCCYLTVRHILSEEARLFNLDFFCLFVCYCCVGGGGRYLIYYWMYFIYFWFIYFCFIDGFWGVCVCGFHFDLKLWAY